jgi:DNA (cytosine-5)-methyltransferase 1
MGNRPTYIDLFAGAGGLSEGFIRAGFKPVAHVEMDKAACNTLLTRTVYHKVKDTPVEDQYISYLKGEISRDTLYTLLTDEEKDSIINLPIGEENNNIIFDKIDKLKGDQTIDLIIGGPPCQAYSVVGRAPLKDKTIDNRKTLYIHYGRFLKRYNPRFFVFENVPGLLSSKDGMYFRNLTKYYRGLGYKVDAWLFNASDFDVIQNRQRVIIIGWKKELSIIMPEHFVHEGNKHARDEIFYDLPSIPTDSKERIHNYTALPNEYLLNTNIRNGLDFVTQHITRPHNLRDLEIYKLAIEKLNCGERIKNNKIPDELRTQNNTEDFLDRFKVVGELPHTMIAHIAKDGHHYIHPDINQLRSISVREAARIQSFPDDYYFEGAKEDQPRSAAFRQIGNAVPPLLATQIAKEILHVLR